MRMKEVCERTGLTDRAVRLYMESGLVTPHEEQNYMGRRSISFDEEDVRALEAVATLRRAELSISDIAAMQATPDALPTIVEQHRLALKEDIRAKQDVLSTLEQLDSERCSDYLALADSIRASASSQKIPKEDLQMNERDVKRFIRSRIPALIALVLLIIGTVIFAFFLTQTFFAEIHFLPRDVYKMSMIGDSMAIPQNGDIYLVYDLDLPNTSKCIPPILALTLLIASTVLTVIGLFNTNRRLLLSSMLCCLCGIALILLSPEALTRGMFVFEVILYRDLFGSVPSSQLLIQSFKMLPLVAACLLSAVGFIKHKTLSDK